MTEGPAKREVPESAMAAQPPLQNPVLFPPIRTSPMLNCQYPFLVTGVYTCSPLKCLASTPPKTSSPPCASSAFRFNQKENTGSARRPWSKALYHTGATL
ncbi:hypothetical protein Mapa_006981 [Marchantia paleacea]|nr:hypothetical protein Mapa_006981 [Marchantia paleacea]